MAWESRRNGNYLYRKERVGVRVISTYVGRGQVAELIGRFEAARREAARLASEKEAEAIAATMAEDRATDDLFEMASELLQVELVERGFHLHKREWRRNAKGKAKTKNKESSAKG